MILTVISLVIFLVGFFVLKTFRKSRFSQFIISLEERERLRQQVRLPPNLDEQGIREIVAKLLSAEDAFLATEQIKLLGERAVPALVEAILNPRFLEKDKSSKLLALTPLGRVLLLLEPFAPQTAIQPLSVLGSHPDAIVRKAAAGALGKIADEACIAPLNLALSDSDDYVRSYAMLGIQRAKKENRGSTNFFEAMFDPIVPLLKREDKSLSKAPETLLMLNRDRAIQVMTDVCCLNLDNPILPQVLYTLNDSEVIIREEMLQELMEPISTKLESYPNDRIYGLCLTSLARARHPSTESTIQNALKHTNKQIVESAAEALAISKGVSKMRRLFQRNSDWGFEQLTEPEKIVLSIYEFEGEVNNGGFSQYFFNSSGDHAETASRGLKEIGASQTAAMLDNAMQLFGRSGPSADRETRTAQLDKLSSKAEKQLGLLDNEFYKDPDRLSVKMWLYIALNSEFFRDRQ